MYGGSEYGAVAYGSVLAGVAVTKVTPDTFSITADVKSPTITITELTSYLSISASVQAPTITVVNGGIIVKINSIEVTDLINWSSLDTVNNLYSSPDIAGFEIIDPQGKSYTPSAGDEIEIYDTGVKVFAGILIKLNKKTDRLVESYDLEFKDWTEELGTILVAESYQNTTVEDIIADIFTNTDLASYDGVTNVSDTTNIVAIDFDNVTVVKALDELSELSNKKWYVSVDKDIYFFSNADIQAPFDLTDTNGHYDYDTLEVQQDFTQIRNRVVVKGKGISAVTVNDTASQAAYGLREYFERDDNINATNEATQSANAILEAYKDPIDIIRFETKKAGLFAGQQIQIDSTIRGISKTINIESVNLSTYTDKKFVYRVQATSQRLGGMEKTYNEVQDTTPTIGNQGHLQDIEFSAIDNETISWTSGVITLADGTSYSISANTSQLLTASHIIYLDPSTSTTELQISTTFSDGIGNQKIPLCYATKSGVSTQGADIFPVTFGGKIQIDGGTHITDNSIITDNIAVNAIGVNELAANAVTAVKCDIVELSAITADLGEITAGTVTGAMIQTSASGRRTVITDDEYIRWYNDNDVEAYISNNGGNLIIDADTSIIIRADGVGDSVTLIAGDDMNLSSVGMYITCTDNWQINSCDTFIVNYNDDDSGDQFYVNEDSGNVLTLSTGKDAYFQDDLDINGTLSKGSGSFKIDHPLKPETHYLYHSFVESPDMLNIYKGRGKIKNGKYIIELPEYFSELNKDIEYSLTPVGKPAILYISKEHKNNKVEVSSDIDCEFSWIVYGVRKDKFALANPIVEEVEKNIKGYIHPELYGETQGLGDKIISENIKRKKAGKEQLPMHNKKGFVKVKSKSKIDSTAMKIIKEKRSKEVKNNKK